jgi:hypothetical protein
LPTCEGDVTYTWTYADCEGNNHDWVYTYTIEYEPFVIATADGSSTVDCFTDVTTPTPPDVYDNCGVLLTPATPVITGTYAGCEGTVIYTFTYTDCESNTDNWVYTYTIEVEDFTMPANDGSTVDCYSDITTPTPPVVTDNCGITITPTGPTMGGTYTTCEGTVTYTWNYADCEGNNHDWVYTYTINDDTPPELNCPPAISVVCAENAPYHTTYAAFVAAGGSASDNCGLNFDSFGWVSDVPSGNTIIRTYRIEDNCGNPATCEQIITVTDLVLDVYVYLEGALINPNGIQTYTLPMRTTLNNLKVLPGQTYYNFFTGTVYSPAGQPYSVAPWNYPGTEGAGYNSFGNPNPGTAGYPPTVVDWILVSLRQAPDGANLCQKAALLHSDGHIEFVNGGFNCCNLSFSTAYYVVIEHRNHLIVMSDVAVTPVDGVITYDFRNKESYVDDPFGFGYIGQKQILPGVYAMITGNGNQVLTTTSDTDINADDRTYWESQNGTAGRYRGADYNLNGDSNNNDRTTWEFNNGVFTTVPRN